MAQQNINIGSSANKGDGDPLRTAFTKINSNFTELYGKVIVLEGGGVADRLDARGLLGVFDGRQRDVLDVDDTSHLAHLLEEALHLVEFTLEGHGHRDASVGLFWLFITGLET